MPARFGVKVALRIAAVSHIAAVACLFGLWQVAELGYIFLAGVIVVAALLTYEHWLVRPDDLSRVNVAFFNVNSVISIGLFLTAVADIYLSRSEERRVGKECRSRWSRYHNKKN